MIEVETYPAKKGKAASVNRRGNGKSPVEFRAPAPSVPLISRDAFVTETSIKLEQVQVELRALRREVDALNGRIGELRKDTDQTQRFYTYLDGEQRAKAGKIDDVARRFGALKDRVDKIDGRSSGDYHAYSSFEAVSRRLTELGAIERSFRAQERQLKLSAGLFCASLMLCIVTVLFS